MDKLLPYFMQEMAILRRNLRDLVRREPQVAATLALTDGESADPAVERMVQGTALLCAQQSRRLERAHAPFTSALLENLEPFYLRPLPSCSIAQVDGTGLRNAVTIPRGTELRTRAGPACRFRTVYDVTLAPVTIASAGFSTCLDTPPGLALPEGAAGAISLTLASTDPASGLGAAAQLRVFIDADAGTRAAAYDALLARSLCACVEVGGQWRKLASLPLTPVGFAAGEAMLPAQPRYETGLRLWAEYFALPEKFDFFDIDVRALLAECPPGTRQLTLHLILPELRDTAAPGLLRTLSAASFRLGCTPVVNLFARPAEPVRLVKGRKTYRLAVPAMGEAEGKFYRLDSARLTGRDGAGSVAAELRPLHAGVYRSGKYYWHAQLADETAGTPDEISIVDGDEQALALDSGTLDMRLTCTNGELPSRLSIGAAMGDLVGEHAAGDCPIRLLRQPTRPYRLADHRDGQWDLIRATVSGYGCESHATLVDMLSLNASPDCVAAQRQLGGILAMEQSEHTKWMAYLGRGLLAYGREIRLTIDEGAFAQRSVFVFARLVDDYFSRGMSCINFNRIVLRTTNGVELLRCAERLGDAAPI